MTGYWPPTDIGITARPGMLWKWRTKQVNYNNSGYDVLAITPTFQSRLGWYDQAMTNPYWGTGSGQLMVDYLDTSEDFWAIVQQHTPIAIMSFSRGKNDRSWELEAAARNRPQDDWVISQQYIDNNGVTQTDTWNPPHPGGSAADFSPYNGQGTIAGNPPDPTKASDEKRNSNLPMTEIHDAIDAAFTDLQINPEIDNSGNVGSFVSEYMAYHVVWYRDYINATHPDDPSKQCQRAGHTHVGVQVAVGNAETAVDIQLDELFKVLS